MIFSPRIYQGAAVTLICVVLISHAGPVRKPSVFANGDGTLSRSGIVGEIDGLLRDLQARGLVSDSNISTNAVLEDVIKALLPGAEVVDGILPDRDGADGAAPVPVVVEEMNGTIMYVRLSRMDISSAVEVAGRIAFLGPGDYRGVIMDVRGAGGSSLSSVSLLVGLFIESNKVVCSVVDEQGSEVESHVAKPISGRPRLPIMVLVDSGTCDACELLAVLLKGTGGVLLVGGRTRGNPRVTENVQLSCGAVVRINRYRIVPGNGVNLDSSCVSPDVEVIGGPDTGEQFPSSDKVETSLSASELKYVALQRRAGTDRVLSRAIDMILAIDATDPDDK